MSPLFIQFSFFFISQCVVAVYEYIDNVEFAWANQDTQKRYKKIKKKQNGQKSERERQRFRVDECRYHTGICCWSIYVYILNGFTIWYLLSFCFNFGYFKNGFALVFNASDHHLATILFDGRVKKRLYFNGNCFDDKKRQPYAMNSSRVFQFHWYLTLWRQKKKS